MNRISPQKAPVKPLHVLLVFVTAYLAYRIVIRLVD